MLLQTSPGYDSPIASVLNEFVSSIVGALPNILTGILFLILAYVGIRVILFLVRGALERAYPPAQALIVDLIVLVIGVFLWFGAILVLLKIVAMGDVAASLGSATGFIGLGVAYALKEMIADTVAGVYLLRDPDFNIGDSVNAASVTGTIRQIDLRKTRIRDENDELVVVANREVEKKWTRKPDGTATTVR